MIDRKEKRLQRTISKLTKQIADLKASRDFWKQQAAKYHRSLPSVKGKK